MFNQFTRFLPSLSIILMSISSVTSIFCIEVNAANLTQNQQPCQTANSELVNNASIVSLPQGVYPTILSESLIMKGEIPLKSLEIAQNNQCSQRIGPFVTQTTAWQRWRQVKNQGYGVSSGVFPCYSHGSRGYCFNVFYSC